MKEYSPHFQRKVGIILTYGKIVANVLVSLLYTPILLRILGKEDYGLYRTIYSAVSMMCVLDFGIGNSYYRFFTQYQRSGEEKKIRGLNGMFVSFYIIIGLIILLYGGTLALHLEQIFSEGLAPEEYQKALTITVIITVEMTLNFFLTIFHIYVNAHEKYIFMRVSTLLQAPIGPLIQLPFLLGGYGSIGLAIAGLIVAILNSGVVIYYAIRHLRFRLSFRNWEPGLLKSVFQFSSTIALIAIVSKINNNLDNLLLTRFCGAAEAAVNTVGTTFFTYYLNFSEAITGVFVLRVYQLVGESKLDSPQQRQALTAFATRVGRLQFLVLALISSGFIIFGQAFLQLWVGPGYEGAYWVAIFRMLPATVPMLQNVCAEIQRAENRHRSLGYVTFFMALLNIAMTVAICRVYRAPGAAFATGLATFIAHGPIMNVIYYRKNNINVLSFWKSIFRQMLGFVIPFGAGIFIIRVIPIETWLNLAVLIVAYIGIYAVFAWKFSMNGEERKLVFSILKRLRRPIR